MKQIIVYTKEKGKIETDNGCNIGGLTLHNEDGPAYQRFNSNGQLDFIEYYKNGKRHRLDGPAHQRFYPGGQLGYEEYYINSTFYTKTEYAVEIFKMKLALL